MKVKFFLIAISLFTVACAGTKNREFACEDCLLIEEDQEIKVEDQAMKAGEAKRSLASNAGLSMDTRSMYDREPASMVGDFNWLNGVQDEFDRIAAESTYQSVANMSPTILVARERWSFLYHLDQNAFELHLDSRKFTMVQTKVENRGAYAFAAAGQEENPVTLSISQSEAQLDAQSSTQPRTPSSFQPNTQSGTKFEDVYAYTESVNCIFELSFWDEKKHQYRKGVANIRGGRCTEIINHLRSYGP